MRNIKRYLTMLLCLCLLVSGLALAEEMETALTDVAESEVVAAPVDIEPVEEEYALQPDVPEGDIAVSAAEAGDDLPKASGVKIDEAHFPDKIFRKYVSDTFDLDHDGYLSEQEREDAFGIYVSSMGITSLKGMEYFPNLYDVFCDDNKLTSIDIGTSILEGLICYGNRIERLDISKNTWQRDTVYQSVIEGNEDRIVENGVIRYGGSAMTTLMFDENTVLVIDDVAVDGSSRTLKNIYLKKKGDNGEIELAVGKKYQIIPSFAKVGNGRPNKVTSSNTKVGSIGKAGVFKAQSKGTTTITVRTTTGKSATIKAKVVSATPEKIEITNGAKATMRVDDGLLLKTKLSPSVATSKLTWKSDNTKVATVSKNGVVVAKKKGTAKIIVKTANGKKDTIKITVKAAKATELSGYMGKKIDKPKEKLGLKYKTKRKDDYQRGYSRGVYKTKELEFHTFDPGKRVCYIELIKGTKYKLAGITLGMNLKTARAKALKYIKDKYGTKLYKIADRITDKTLTLEYERYDLPGGDLWRIVVEGKNGMVTSVSFAEGDLDMN